MGRSRPELGLVVVLLQAQMEQASANDWVSTFIIRFIAWTELSGPSLKDHVLNLPVESGVEAGRRHDGFWLAGASSTENWWDRASGFTFLEPRQ